MCESANTKLLKRWVNRPDGSTWGDFGPDDQHGRMNLITNEKRQAALAEVKEGRTFCLSLPLDRPGGSVLNGRRRPKCIELSERIFKALGLVYPTL